MKTRTDGARWPVTGLYLGILAAGLLASTMLSGCASTQVGEKTGLASQPTGQQVTPPFGYVGFCVRHPEECAGGSDNPQPATLDARSWAELVDVNNHVNALPQVFDAERFDREEWWEFAAADGGDCEDFALEKRRLLIERGWAPENLLLAVAQEWNGDGHAVLIVVTDKGDFVLDNKDWQIVGWEDAPYTWVKRQSRERPFIWVNLDTRIMRDSAVEMPPLGEPAPFLVAANRSESR